MNRSDEQLARLLRAARQGRPEQAEVSAPFGLETRVLAAWRGSLSSAGLWDTAVLVRGLVVAAFLVTASLWPALEQRANPDAENLQFAESTVQTDLSP